MTGARFRRFISGWQRPLRDSDISCEADDPTAPDNP